jgi:hypothetical protein
MFNNIVQCNKYDLETAVSIYLDSSSNLNLSNSFFGVILIQKIYEQKNFV